MDVVTLAPLVLMRGSVVTVALSGDYGKPRPAIIVQSDVFNTTEQDSFTIALVTSTLQPEAPIFRLTVDPSAANGLRKLSQIMVDKLMTTPRDRIGSVIGRLDDDLMIRLTRAIALWLGLGGAIEPDDT